MEHKQQKHIIDLLFVITLFFIFALSAIFLITIGANVYGQTVNAMGQNFNTRTSIAYLTEKIRQADQENCCHIGELDGIPAISISTSTANTTYITYLYEYDGYIRELTVSEKVSLSPSAGQEILPVSSFQLHQINDNLFSCNISVDKEQSYQLFISLHSGGLTNEY